MSKAATDPRRATAERNVQAILDAAERLLEERGEANVAAVAAAAGVSRVTVYAHFPTKEALLEAVVERAVNVAHAAIEGADLDSGTPLEALDRLIEAGWRQLDRHAAVARASEHQLSAAARRRSHEAGLAPVRRLVDRGRREDVFRTDVPADWLWTCFFALIHAAADDVNSRGVSQRKALDSLHRTIRDVFVGGSG